MRIDSFIITLLLITTTIVIGVAVINDQALYDDSFSDNDTFSRLTNLTDQLFDESKKMQSQLNGSIEEDNVFEFLLKGGKQFLNIVWQVISIPGTVLGEIATLIGIPKILVQMATTGILILVAFAILYMFFRFQNR